MNNPTLYILTGLPYAGKSTLRKVLVKRFGFAVISIDEINTEYAVGIDENKTITQVDWNRTYSEAYKRLRTFLREGKDVIFDGGSLLLRERETQRQIAEDEKATSHLIYVNTPIELIKERWLKNQSTKERGHVPTDLFEAALQMWEEPSIEESPIVYDQQMNIENWIKKNITSNPVEAK